MLRIGEFRFLLPEFRAQWRSYACGTLLILLTSFFLTSVPRIIQEAITALERGQPARRVAEFALAIVGAVLLRGITSFWMRRIVIGASRRIEAALRNRLFRHLQTLDRAYFDRFHTGDLMSRFTSDIEAVRMSVGPGVMYSINTVCTLGFATALMVWISPRLTIYSFMPLLLLSVVIRYLGPRMHRESMRAQERIADLSVHAQESFTNARVIQAFVREESENRRMLELANGAFEQNMRVSRLRAATVSCLRLMGDLLVLVLILVGGWELIRGDLTLAEFAAFKGCQLLLVWPMIALGWVLTLLQRGAASARRLREILEARPRIDDSRVRAGVRVERNSVSYRGVEFAHDSGPPVLRGIDFALPEGATLGIVGATGSGKSTLLELAPRLHEATRGRVEVGGVPVAELPLAELRGRVGHVPQEPFLFSATVAENIAFGAPDASAEGIREVARIVGIADEIEEFPDGYDQRVGERGITLSGGQRQRLALARTLLPRPPILLLDDVLSAVDASTEDHILRALRHWTRDLTVLIVSHRLSAVRHADEILVLEEGRIIQRGAHDALVAQEGYYRDLHRKQSLEDELESL